MSEMARDPDTGKEQGPETKRDQRSGTLLERHRDELTAQAIEPAIIDAVGVRSIEHAEQLPEGLPDYWANYLPAKLYPWRLNGSTVWQLAPDDRSKHKYLFPDDAEPPLSCIRDTGGPVLFVEGTKQHLAAASYAPAEYAIYGVFGCWGWSKADLSFLAGRAVWVAFDADHNRNADVYDAAVALRDALEIIDAAEIKFIKLPGPGSQGLDDFLSNIKDPTKRHGAMARLIDKAAPELGRRPQPKKKGNRSAYFSDNGSLKAQETAHAVWKMRPCLLTPERSIAVYQDGAYHIDPTALMSALVNLLGDDYKPGHLTTVQHVLIGTLRDGKRFLPDRLDEPLLNVANGLVDLRTGELRDHRKDVLTSTQLPVEYDPAAQCPTYERWAAEIVGPDQLDDLEEAAAAMLDPTGTPQKAVFLYGPSRSGKSTFLRILEATAGPDNRTSVSLHQLAENRFAAANVYGKILNASADLSAAHVSDLSIFKLMTGEDSILADRKYGHQFSFTNRALFAFSANEIPTVSETSRAYVERIKPFRFGNSFAGHEDPSIEAAIMAELPGILVRLVRAWQRRQQRGTVLPTVPEVAAEFEAASDRVQQWADEELTIVRTSEDGHALSDGAYVKSAYATTPADLARMFNAWAEANNTSTMGRNKIVGRLTSMDGVRRVFIKENHRRALNIIQRPESDRGPATVRTLCTSEPTVARREINGPEEKGKETELERVGGKVREVRADPATCPRCGGPASPVHVGGNGARPWCDDRDGCGWRDTG